jgi:hypothetical protein
VIGEVFGFAAHEGERTINYSSPHGPALTLSYTRKGQSMILAWALLLPG